MTKVVRSLRWQPRRRVYVLLLALLFVLALWQGVVGAVEGSHTELLVQSMRERNLMVDPADVIWLDGEAGLLGTRSVLFAAEAPGELPDLYLADARRTRGGSWLGVWQLSNITRTSSAEERALAREGSFVAYATMVGDQHDAVFVVDTSGEPAELTAHWPLRARVQNHITNLLELGRWQGLGRTRFELTEPAERLTIEGREGRFVVRADDRVLEIDPAARQARPSQEFAVQPALKSEPGTLTWAVDTVRNLSWVGAEPIEWLEHTVFGIVDRGRRLYHGVVKTDTEAEVREDLGVSELAEPLLDETHPELGWPPAPVEPVLEQSVKGEGTWIALRDDPFINANPNAPPAFVQTFLRVDPEREFARVYITLWDARQVQLHIVSGTSEPESATGETGTGEIPRDDRTLRRLVGAFNGGFQALHGEFGMMADGRVYLPPKPWAATVAVFEDGRVGMGSWPGPGKRRWDEEMANEQIPDDMISMRQNLTSVVEGDRFNPWKRWYWGAAPKWAEEQTYIPRTGLCLTKEGFMAFFYGESMGPEELGKAMLATRCVRGMHLDINDKHTGMEFYRTFAPEQRVPALGRELTEAEAEEPIRRSGGYRVRARKSVRSMSPMRFPRYIRRDPRDFFYLTLKPVLPGPDLEVGSRTIAFDTSGLPHAGWPHAFARAKLQNVWLVRIDPARVVTPGGERPADALPLGYVLAAARADGPLALHATEARVGVRLAVGQPAPSDPVWLRGAPLDRVADARAAVGVDGDGFLVYAEAGPGADATALRAALRHAGVQQALGLGSARLAFRAEQGAVSVDGRQQLGPVSDGDLTLWARTHPAAEVIYPNVEPRPYRFWGWLQDKRVRYFPPSSEPRFPTPEAVK